MATGQVKAGGEVTQENILHLLSEQVAALLERTAEVPRPDAAELARTLAANRGPIRVAPGHHVHDPVELHSCEFGHRIEIHGVTFHQVVDLNDARLHKTVDFTGCQFLRGLSLEGAHIGGSLVLDECTFGLLENDPLRRSARLGLVRVGGNLNAQAAWMEGSCDLAHAEVRGDLIFRSTPRRNTRLRGDLRLSRADVEGSISLSGVHALRDVLVEAVEVGGDVSLAPLREDVERREGRVVALTRIGGNLFAAGADIRGELDLNAVRVRHRVNLQAAKIRRGVFCRMEGGKRPVLAGGFEAPYSTITATADFRGAVICKRVFMEGAVVAGAVFMNTSEATEPEPATGERVRSTYVHGPVQMSTARATAVETIGARIAGSLELNNVEITGTVVLVSATITGDVQLASASMRHLILHHPEMRPVTIGADLFAPGARINAALQASGIEVGGFIDFAGARVTGDAVFERVPRDDAELFAPPAAGIPARCGGNFIFQDAVVTGRLVAPGLRCGGVLRLARAEVRGDLCLSEARVHLPTGAAECPSPLTAPPQGALDATAVRVRGRFQCNGAMVCGALNLQNAWIGGGLYCGSLPDEESVQETAGLKVAAGVLLDGAEVMKQADFRKASIADELSLERVQLEGRLRCPVLSPDDNTPPSARVRRLDLRNLRVRHLDLTDGSPLGLETAPRRSWLKRIRWPGPRGQRAHHPAMVQGAPIVLDGCVFQSLSVPRRDYTALFPHRGEPFSQSAFDSVEQWLRDRGDDARAERVYAMMLRRRRETMSRLTIVADRAVELLRLSALRFQWLIALSLLAYGLSAALFSLPGALEKGKGAPAAAARAKTLPPPQPTVVDAALTAAKVHLPMVGFPGDDDWKPAGAEVTVRGWSLWVRYDVYGVVVSLLSYAVIPLIIGGIASTWIRRGGRKG